MLWKPTFSLSGRMISLWLQKKGCSAWLSLAIRFAMPIFHTALMVSSGGVIEGGGSAGSGWTDICLTTSNESSEPSVNQPPQEQPQHPPGFYYSASY